MLVDLDKAFWIDTEDKYVVSILMIGFCEAVNIVSTEFAIDVIKPTSFEGLDRSLKYTSIFNGRGNSLDEMNKSIESNFDYVPIPDLFPIIGQSSSLYAMKKDSIRYLEILYGAIRSRKELSMELEYKDKLVTELIDRYMNMFTIKNELN